MYGQKIINKGVGKPDTLIINKKKYYFNVHEAPAIVE